MDKRRKILSVIIIVLFVSVVLGVFIYISNKPQDEEEQEVIITPVDNVVLRDLEFYYPPTPKEVLEYYSDITTCFYQEELTEDDLYGLAETAWKLYDEELRQSMVWEEYIEALRADILEFNSMGIVVSGYTLSSSTDVEYYDIDEGEYAKIYATYRLRQGTEYIYSDEVFVMRKDENGHWKILGWELLEEEEVEELISEQNTEQI